MPQNRTQKSINRKIWHGGTGTATKEDLRCNPRNCRNCDRVDWLWYRQKKLF